MAVTSPPARLWAAARQLPDRTPLRVKLISALLALVAIALVVISIAGISVLKSYLLGQADGTLQNVADQSPRFVQNYLLGASAGIQNGGVAVAWLPSGGHVHPVIEPGAGFGRQSQGRILPLPAVPTTASWLAANDQRLVTVPAESGDSRWRVLVFHHQFATADGSIVSGTVIVGLDVSNVYATIGHLIGIDLIVSLIIILVLAIVGITVVRRSLRPLTEIERTAEAIAAGDLTRRVPDRDPRTEVGSLGRSLNAMLSHVETAFQVRAESEFAARRSEERIRQFVADASHELRTPLTAIRGFAEYYRQRGGLANGRPENSGPENSGPENSGPDDGAGAGIAGTQDGPVHGRPAADPGAAAAPRGGSPLTRVDLDRIMRRVEQESSRMGVLVEDMLLLARLDQQRPLENRPVDLLTLAADAVHDARVMAPRRSIDLTVGAGAALIVLGDEVRLRQVIGNLMSNALTHTPDGTPVQVRIRSGALDEGRAHAGEVTLPPPGPEAETSTSPPAVILEVADRGPGLTPEQSERAFERFYRADQARARQAGGTGLGLAIVAALVVAHGGRVSVEPTPGSGATFRIALPLAPEVLDLEATDLEATDPDAPGPDAPGPEAPGPVPAGRPGEEPHAGPGPAAS
jgi:two-component system, OmpR family, sensor kinase